MLEDHVDWKRVALCCKIGRRFWSMCKVFRLYADVNFHSRYLNISFKNTTLENDSKSIELSGNLYRRILKFREIKGNSIVELFRFYDEDFFIDALNFKSISRFQKYYNNIGLDAMSEEFVNVLYYSTVDHVPLEIHFINAVMRGIDGTKYGNKSYPLIFALYKNNDLINFFDKLTADLMFNPTYHLFLKRGSFPRNGGMSTMDSMVFEGNIFANVEERIGLDCKKLLKTVSR